MRSEDNHKNFFDQSSTAENSPYKYQYYVDNIKVITNNYGQMSKMRNRMLCFISALLLISPLSAFELIPYQRGDISEEVFHFINQLASKDNSKASNLLAYPESFTSEELSEDKASVSSSISLLQSHFGTFNVLGITPRGAEFYELGLYGGDMYWWKDSKDTHTKEYLYTVNFSKLGTGYIKLFTKVQDGQEKVVMFFYCLPPREGESIEKLIQVLDLLLDSMGVPKGHPARDNLLQYFPIMTLRSVNQI